ncbi:cell division protein FtsQ/DivIB [Ancylomarina longa]|uniref:FtsQ-type POTRA domain-containing protein n=1 Tax=Ancylomarina longa TaxID=2487017 RepID=A0A434AUP3_9BACT|nr:FtsQ-type POTRA domain-containing protein [Ancylomarina longa]RUT78147.1 FtsQ-type POTRA domain-containing protein [Ancylomarina longa]
MLKKITNILLWVLIIGYLMVSFSFVTEKKNQLTYTDIKVNVVDSLNSGFVSESDVEKIIKKKYPRWKGESILNINKEVLEDNIDKIPFVKKAEVYHALNGKLVIDIQQRKPIVRILSAKGYYLDMEGNKMPLSNKFTSRVLVVSGVVTDQLIKEELYELVNFIINDEFWKSQITQIYVNNNREYILIPRVGAQKIDFGGIDHYKRKFKKLYALYTEGFSKTGWNKYNRINLKYENQVVCTKKK